MKASALHALIIMAVCALVYFVNLGAPGLRSTEGHRAIPGWEALEFNRWLPTTLFEATYVRKPPGMPWAIAAVSMVFGETEFAARLPSALSASAMALVAMIFASRWFGQPWGIAAGLAQALMPRFWSPGRTADIEALLCLGVQIAAMALIHVLAHRKGTPRRTELMWALIAATGLIIALLAKAHAGMPVVAGVVVGACIVRRSARPLGSLVFVAAMVMGMLAVLPVAIVQIRALRGDAAISEDFGKFLWDGARLSKWLIFPFVVWASGFPASLALLFPWGPDARAECAGEPLDLRPRMMRVARCLALGFLVSVGIYWIAGVSNERYAMPTLVLMPPLVAYVARGMTEFFTARRARIARVLMLGGPRIIVPLLALGGVGVFPMLEKRDARSTARPDALVLAASLPDAAILWADAWVNAKPELIWYAVREAGRTGHNVRPLWKHAEISAAEWPPAGTLMLLKNVELERYRGAPGGSRLRVLATGAADGTPFTLVAVGE